MHPLLLQNKAFINWEYHLQDWIEIPIFVDIIELNMYEPYQIPKRKRIPYGMMNFIDVREDDCYFVDKTVFIPALEAANKFFWFSRFLVGIIFIIREV